MGAEKIKNVAFSCFSAPIFPPAYLTNDRNSSSRELLVFNRIKLYHLPQSHFKHNQRDVIALRQPGRKIQHLVHNPLFDLFGAQMDALPD